MKEERKEKNNKSHIGSAGWSTGRLRYQKPAARTAYALGTTLRYAGRAAGADSPRGSCVPDSAVCPPHRAPLPGARKATQCKP